MTTRISPVEDSGAEQVLPAGHQARGRHEGRRFARFVFLVAVLLLGVNAFVCGTWGHFSGTRGWIVWQAIPGVVVLGFIATTLIGFRYSNRLLQVIYGLSASWLGALNFAFFAAMACWVVAAVGWLTGWPLSRIDIALTLFGAALLATVYGLANAAWLRVTRVTVHLRNLPTAWAGRTALLVTDLHLGHLSGPGFLRRVLDADSLPATGHRPDQRRYV